MNEKSPIKEEHYNTWLEYFEMTVDELFDGEKALEAKQRARSISTIVRIKTLQN